MSVINYSESGTDKLNHFPPRRSSARPVSTQSMVNSNDAMLNSHIANEIETEILRFESVHPYIYQLYAILDGIPPTETKQQLTALVTKIEDAFVNSEEWTLSRAAHSLRVGVIGALDSGKTSLVHYFLTGNAGVPSSTEGGRFKKCVNVDNRPFLARIRDEGSSPPEYQMTNYRHLGDVPVVFVGTLDQPLDENGDCDETISREVSMEEAHSASVTLKMSEYFECFTYTADVNEIFLTAERRILVFRQILHKQRLGHGGQSCSSNHQQHSHRYSLNGNLSGGRVQELHHHQSSVCPGSSRKSVGVPNYHHQRSISAVPIPPSVGISRGNGGAVPPLLPIHQTTPQQLSPSGPIPVVSSRNAGRSALKRQNYSYCPSRGGHQYTAPQPSHQFFSNQKDNLSSSSICSVYSGSLASVPSVFNQEFTELPRSDSFASASGVETADGRNNGKPQFRRESAFGRASERSSYSSFVMPLSSTSAHHHAVGLQPHQIMHSNERISTPEIGASTSGRLGSFLGNTGLTTMLGISPAYSHSSLASQYSYSNGAASQYSRSTSNVVENFKSSAPPPLPPPPPPTSTAHRSGPFPFYDDSASVSSLYAGGIAFTDSLNIANGESPVVTPNTQRKNRRISSIFRAKEHHHSNGNTPESGSGMAGGSPSVSSLSKSHAPSDAIVPGMGVGREIPVKEGYLYKKSNKALNREWKKKYVCLYADGMMKYYSSNKDYRNDYKGKSLYVGLATVRLRRPRASVRNSLLPQQQQIIGAKDISEGVKELDEGLPNENGTSTPGEGGTSGNSDGGVTNDLQRVSLASSMIVAGQLHHQDLGPSKNSQNGVVNVSPNKSASNRKPLPITNASVAATKKKQKRLGSSAKNNEDEEDCEFEIIASDQTHWEFAAQTAEERAEWVRQIEELIEKCLQAQTSQKQQQNAGAHGNKADVAALRELSGNDVCADCGQQRPDWASLNLGTLICIECSGIHRNLGSHISRVRSLDLDDWPNEFLCVMQAIGNQKANSVWEYDAPLTEKPSPSCARKPFREVKEAWIKKKYEQKAFLPPLTRDLQQNTSLGQCIIKAVLSRDIEALLRILPRATEEDVNTIIGASTMDDSRGATNVKNTAGLTTSGYENNDSKRVDRRTALHLACSYDAADILQLLIWYNADVRALDENTKSALWYSRLASSNNCRSILLNAGLEPDYGLGETSSNSNSRPPSKNDGDAKKSIGSEFCANDAQSRMARLSAEAAEAARHLRHHTGNVVTLRKTYEVNTDDGAFLPKSNIDSIREYSSSSTRTPMDESIISMVKL